MLLCPSLRRFERLFILNMGKTQSLEIESPLRCKLLIMGAPGVGKTSIVRSLGLKFSEEYEHTLGCELTVNQTYMKGKPVKLICMDSLTETDLHLKCRLKTIKNCDIAMFVFDLSNKKSNSVFLSPEQNSRCIKNIQGVKFYCNRKLAMIEKKS